MHRLTKRQLGTMLQIAHDCLDVTRPEDLVPLCTRMLEEFPSRGAVISMVRPAPTGTEIVDFVNHSWDQRWCDHYLHSGFAEVDPVLRTGVVAERPFAWREIFASSDPGLTQVMPFLSSVQDFGMMHGATHGCRTRRWNTISTLFSVRLDSEVVPPEVDLVLRHLVPLTQKETRSQ
jgi:hypothetical protein